MNRLTQPDYKAAPPHMDAGSVHDCHFPVWLALAVQLFNALYHPARLFKLVIDLHVLHTA